MSEESKKVLGINQLPIFPLPLVLMPFELLNLHIFEPRYQELLADVSAEKGLFGVSRFEPSSEFDERPAIGSCGCVAEIRESEALEDGRSNILVVGIIRYEITGYAETDGQYLIADVSFFEDTDQKEPAVEILADEVFGLFKRVAKAAHKLSGQPGEFSDIPKAPAEQLSFLVSAAFSLQLQLKYELLELRSTVERLERVREILGDSVKRVEETALIDKVSRTNGHAKKKIGLDS
jgi:ATP-dependent Lon protease